MLRLRECVGFPQNSAAFREALELRGLCEKTVGWMSQPVGVPPLARAGRPCNVLAEAVLSSLPGELQVSFNTAGLLFPESWPTASRRSAKLTATFP